MNYFDIYHLKLGDKFKEDNYKETWEVVGFSNGTDFNTVQAINRKSGEITDWGYSNPGYSPHIYLV